jgi:hypothetical protein
MPSALITIGCYGRKATHDHRRLGEAQSAAQQREHRKQGHRLAHRCARHERDSGQREKRSHDGGGTETLLALQHRKQQGRQRHDREQRLPKAGVNPLEAVVRQREGAPEVQCAEEQGSGERSSARQGEP